MQVFWKVLIVLVMLFGPRLMILLSDRFKIFNMLGPVFLCYACGILLSLVMPERAFAMDIAEVLVPIAIPIILFSADLTSVKRLARPMLRSFLLLIIAVVAVTAAAFFLFRDVIDNAYQYCGMAVGVYVGGTPNLMAIGRALEVDSTHIVLANTSDVVVGGVYFLLLIGVMPRLVRRFLPKFVPGTASAHPEDAALADRIEKSFVPEKERFSFRTILTHLPIILLGVLSLGVAAGISLLITGKIDTVVLIMLVVTTCGIGLSFIKKVRTAPGSYATGQYLILMFSFGIGLSFDIGVLDREALLFLALFATAQFGSIIVHLILARFARIDADTALITSTAGIYGPAFIGPTANALGNREVVLPGLICGILGHAIGNYVGIGVALLLKLIGG